jgi:N-acetylmuramoyl-L-alanine amidase
MQIKRPYQRGDVGPVVAEIRAKLASVGLLPSSSHDLTHPDESVFDEQCDRAVREFQQHRGLTVDGLVGPETYLALDEARWRLGDRVLAYSVSRPLRGDDIAVLQQRLIGMGFDCYWVDGIFGPATEAALRDFQQHAGLPADGTCGPATFRVLEGLPTTAAQTAPAPPRTVTATTSLHGKTVVVDPGHGGMDRGNEGFGLDEASLVEDLAARIEGRLSATGVEVFLTRGPDGELNDVARADFGNATQADLFVSLHVDSHPSPEANGLGCFYYGSDPLGRRSPVGEQFAGLVQREIVARTDLTDLGVWGKTWELLRRTRMPTVRVELGYLSNADDVRRLASPDFRDTVADAVVVAVRRLFLPRDLDAPTGQLDLASLTS